MSGNFKTSCKFKQGTVERESIVEFALDSLPPLLDMVPEREGTAYVFTLNANHGHAIPLIKQPRAADQLLRDCGKAAGRWTYDDDLLVGELGESVQAAVAPDLIAEVRAGLIRKFAVRR